MKHVVCRNGKAGVEYYQGDLFGTPIFSTAPALAKSYNSAWQAAAAAYRLGDGGITATIIESEKKAVKSQAAAAT